MPWRTIKFANLGIWPCPAQRSPGDGPAQALSTTGSAVVQALASEGVEGVDRTVHQRLAALFILLAGQDAVVFQDGQPGGQFFARMRGFGATLGHVADDA